MESIEIDIKKWMSLCRRKTKKEAGRCWNKKQAQGDAHSRPRGENLSKQCFPPVCVRPNTRDQRQHVISNAVSGELMMMRRTKMMMAILCFPLTLPPWSELFELQSCELKYVRLSSVSQRLLLPEGAPPLSQNVFASVIRLCGRSEDTCIFISSFVYTISYQVMLQIQVMDYQTRTAHFPYGSPAVFLSLNTAHTLLLRQAI